MTFDPRQQMTIEAARLPEGGFRMLTRGLQAQGRPELEMLSVPEAALKAVAANVLNDLADYTVNKKEVRADELVGSPISITGSEAPPLLMVSKLVWSVRPSGGLLARAMGKGDRGVLRVIDPTAQEESAPAWTLITSAMVHRAEALAVSGQGTEALRELEAAIALFPGDFAAGAEPGFGQAGADYNWQNRIAYQRWSARAEAEESEELYARALAAVPPLARWLLGAPLEELAALDLPAYRAAVQRVRTRNLADAQSQPGPNPALVILRSAVWRVRGATVERGLSLLPRAFEDHYFGGVARAALEGNAAVLESVAAALHRERDRPWRLLPFAQQARDQYGSEDSFAPAQPVTGAKAEDDLASAVLADTARCLRAGLTVEEVDARLRGAPSEEARHKLQALADWEGGHYTAAISGGG